MRIVSPPGSGAFWLDRSPSSKSLGWTGVLTNDAGGTTRATFLVQPGKRAFVGDISCIMQCTAANAGDFARALWTYTPSGGSGVNAGGAIVNCGNLSFAHAINNSQNGGNFYMAAGDQLVISTVTVGTVATTQVYTGVAILEFDA